MCWCVDAKGQEITGTKITKDELDDSRRTFCGIHLDCFRKIFNRMCTACFVEFNVYEMNAITKYTIYFLVSLHARAVEVILIFRDAFTTLNKNNDTFTR